MLKALGPDQAVITGRQEHLTAEPQHPTQLLPAVGQLPVDFTTAPAGRQLGDIEHLEGIGEIRALIAALVRDVSTEVMTFAAGGARSEAVLEATGSQAGMLLERGVRMRTLYPEGVRTGPVPVAYAKWLTDLGGQVRVARSLPVRLLILDHRTAIVPIDENDGAAGALAFGGIRSGGRSGTVTALCALFESMWEGAVPLGEGADPLGESPGPSGESPGPEDEPRLTPRRAEVLRLLGQGLTDEAVAKRLGISCRTAARIAADLLDRLDARSRFEAGARAMAKGWLTSEE